MVLPRLLALKEMTTRQLVHAYKHRFRGSEFDEVKPRVELTRTLIGGVVEHLTYTPQEIKAELDTREHIPNKKEAKALRQKKAQSRR